MRLIARRVNFSAGYYEPELRADLFSRRTSPL